MTRMTSQELMSLAERCESATGADRELDALIAAANRKNPESVFGGPLEPPQNPRHFTASLDAAMALVPEAWGWTAGVNGDGSGCAYIYERDDESEREHSVDAATPALALCAAALRARASSDAGGRG